ncbi:hypothetical protein AcW1_001575 [Taiwanofungus camphoratus]|nr:hypothetical protein AcV7_003577 [Antrodia cinnamomea]KAI0938778.1 hypothetical protein AcV5_000384 [Antrodia cinnamomea]KAI0945329.1 hypothetical protein AcW1_001575 [Antrodia cinnamomea]
MVALKSAAFSFHRSLDAPDTLPQAPRSHRQGKESLWKIPLPRSALGSAKTLSAAFPRSRRGVGSKGITALDFDGSFYDASDVSLEAPAAGTSANRGLQALQLALAAPHHMPLIPLSFAQRRNDIRRRIEGFEMAFEPEFIPFALRTQTLIPLRDAHAREDIRRRGEGFEMAEAKRLARRMEAVSHEADHSKAPRDTIADYEAAETSVHLSATSTVPSIYSSESWKESASEHHGTKTEDAIQASPSANLVSVINGSPRDRNPGDGYSRRNAADLSTSSFDEESFLRMAAPLGW